MELNSVLTPGSEGMKGAIAEAIAAERNGFLPLQFETPTRGYERTTGQEIVDAFGKDGLDAFVAGAGTGIPFLVFHTLKKNNPMSKSGC